MCFSIVILINTLMYDSYRCATGRLSVLVSHVSTASLVLSVVSPVQIHMLTILMTLIHTLSKYSLRIWEHHLLLLLMLHRPPRPPAHMPHHGMKGSLSLNRREHRHAVQRSLREVACSHKRGKSCCMGYVRGRGLHVQPQYIIQSIQSSESVVCLVYCVISIRAWMVDGPSWSSLV